MKLKSIALILMTVALPAMAEKVSVNTKGMSLILDVENGKPAQYLYFGTKLNPTKVYGDFKRQCVREQLL